MLSKWLVLGLFVVSVNGVARTQFFREATNPHIIVAKLDAKAGQQLYSLLAFLPTGKPSPLGPKRFDIDGVFKVDCTPQADCLIKVDERSLAVKESVDKEEIQYHTHRTRPYRTRRSQKYRVLHKIFKSLGSQGQERAIVSSRSPSLRGTRRTLRIGEEARVEWQATNWESGQQFQLRVRFLIGKQGVSPSSDG